MVFHVAGQDARYGAAGARPPRLAPAARDDSARTVRHGHVRRTRSGAARRGFGYSVSLLWRGPAAARGRRYLTAPHPPARIDLPCRNKAAREIDSWDWLAYR